MIFYPFNRMKKNEITALIKDALDKYFPSPEIPLSRKDPYTLLIAVLLSAQCTDKCVNKVTEKLFQKASSPEEMIALSLDQIEKIIKPCGLFHKKARAIIELSKILVDKYKGKVPKTLKKLEELPGVGHKTASVLISQAFKKAAFPVDTHIMRLAKRWGLSNGKTALEIENDLKQIFPKNSWAKVHLQIIYFGKTYCKAAGHIKEKCPICKRLS
jgi:endonuclease III